MTRPVTVGGRRGWQPPTVTRRSRVRGQRGAATVEAAAVLPVLIALTIGLVWLMAVASTQVRVVDGAREAARAAARGESDAVATAAGRAVAPENTRFAIRRGGGNVTVVAVAGVRGPGGLFQFVPAVEVSSRAVAREEPR